jgi:hypothetical protein
MKKIRNEFFCDFSAKFTAPHFRVGAAFLLFE